MDGRQFTIALFRDGPPPAVLRLETPVPVHAAIMGADGRIDCAGWTVNRLADLPTLCRALLAAGLPDAALQVKTWRGEPVCFLASLADIGRPDDVGTPSPQLSFGFDA